MLGYPDQALQKSYEPLTLAQELTHPFSLAIALATTVTFISSAGKQQLPKSRPMQLIHSVLSRDFRSC